MAELVLGIFIPQLLPSFCDCLILCFKSVYGSLEDLSGGMLIAALANESAFSFPWIPIWPGIQQNMIFFALS